MVYRCCTRSIPASCTGIKAQLGIACIQVQTENHHFLQLAVVDSLLSQLRRCGVIWTQNVELCATITTSAWFCIPFSSQRYKYIHMEIQIGIHAEIQILARKLRHPLGFAFAPFKDTNTHGNTYREYGQEYIKTNTNTCTTITSSAWFCLCSFKRYKYK